MPFTLSCRDETKQTDRCAIGARQALAALPLGKTFLLTKRGAEHVWQAGITETAPGQFLWGVDIDAKPGSGSINMAWKIPAPF